MSAPLHWDKKKADLSTGIVFGVMFFVVFGLMMDDMIFGIAIGIAFFAAFGLLSGRRCAWWRRKRPQSSIPPALPT